MLRTQASTESRQRPSLVLIPRPWVAFLGAILGLAAPGGVGGGAETPPAGKLKAIKVVYKTLGNLPGSGLSGESLAAEEARKKKKDVSRQEILVDATGDRLVFHNFQEAPRPEAKTKPEGDKGAAPKDLVSVPQLAPAGEYILREDMAPPIIYRILEGGNTFSEHSGDLNDLQKDRRIQEMNAITLAGKMTQKERDAFFKENPWLKPDGSREVNVVRELGDKVMGRQCEHVVVSENGRTVIDAQVTKEIPGARSYYEIYRRLGAFSEEVLGKISDIQGLPLKGKIKVITALPVYDLEVEATSIESVEVDPGVFSPPPDAKRVDEVPAELKCAFCGAKINAAIDNVPAKAFLDEKWLYFCCEEHADKYMETLVGGGTAPQPPKPEPAKKEP